MLSDYQQQLRAKFLSAPVVVPPEPWRYLDQTRRCIPVGGLQGSASLFTRRPTSTC